MGDRANVVIVDEQDPKSPFEGTFLYGHWSGCELPGKLKTALHGTGKGRLGDGSYLARIIFCEMVKGDEAAETGFGISTRLTDNEYPLLVVDIKRQVVVEYPESVYREHGFAKLDEYPGVKFEKYTGRWDRDAEDDG